MGLQDRIVKMTVKKLFFFSNENCAKVGVILPTDHFSMSRIVMQIEMRLHEEMPGLKHVCDCHRSTRVPLCPPSSSSSSILNVYLVSL